jgi:hypothetical protein
MCNLHYVPTTLGVQKLKINYIWGYANKKGWIPLPQMIHEYAEAWWNESDRVNLRTRRRTCPTELPHGLTWARTLASALREVIHSYVANTKPQQITCFRSVESHWIQTVPAWNQYVGTPVGGEGGVSPKSCDCHLWQETNRTRPSRHQSA